MRQMVAALIASALLLGAAVAQEPSQAPPPPRENAGQRAGGMRMNGTAGTITAIEGDTLTLKTLDGKEAKAKISDKTVFRKDRNEAKLADFKAGDMVLIRGEQNPDGSWSADAIVSRSDMGRFGVGQPGTGHRPAVADGGNSAASAYMARLAEGMGKQFIVGTIKEINGTKLTIDRPDKVSQTVEVDENTSFRMIGAQGNSESVTLADIKPGVVAFGCGALNKDGVFVPTVLTIGQPGVGMVGSVRGCLNGNPPQK